jgi:hypothetical protein
MGVKIMYEASYAAELQALVCALILEMLEMVAAE